jgi:hypothetical protein
MAVSPFRDPTRVTGWLPVTSIAPVSPIEAFAGITKEDPLARMAGLPMLSQGTRGVPEQSFRVPRFSNRTYYGNDGKAQQYRIWC